jgi:hypothetical protein
LVHCIGGPSGETSHDAKGVYEHRHGPAIAKALGERAAFRENGGGFFVAGAHSPADPEGVFQNILAGITRFDPDLAWARIEVSEHPGMAEAAAPDPTK